MDDKDFNKLSVNIGYFSHRQPTPVWRLAEAHVLWTDITYVIGGSAEYTIDGVTYKVKKGDLLCTPQGALRSAYTFPDDLLECYCISGPIYNAAFQETALPFPVLTHIGMHHDLLAMWRQLKSVWLAREPGYELKARGIYMVMLQRLFQMVYHNDKEYNYDKRIKKAIAYVIDHYFENLTVGSVGELLGLSASYFGNLFKAETGMSFHQYLTDIRLNHAEDMLRSGDYKVNEIAWACGFSDPFYFSKVFRKSRGIAPSKALDAPAHMT